VLIPGVAAHLLCAGLVVVDVMARVIRLRLITKALGHDVRPMRLLAIALVGDAASLITPFKAGGDPARVAGLMRVGLSLRESILIQVIEGFQHGIVLLGGGLVLAALYGPGLWIALSAAWSSSTLGVIGFVALAGMLCLGALYVVRRFRPGGLRPDRPSLPRAQWGQVANAAFLRTLPLSLLSNAARVLILPVLLATLVRAPHLGQMLLASFALLHGQSVIPIPAGAGAVELGFLAALRGSAGAGQLLLYWRIYTAGFGLLLGAVAFGLTWVRRFRPAASALVS
jgi:uncharacterized membrane protein YbhN (UPF0104 family)